MIIERNEFHIKFGRIREAKALFLEIIKMWEPQMQQRARLLTDISGHAYTLVLEMQHASLSQWETDMQQAMNDAKMRELYMQFIPLCDSSSKTFYRIETLN